MDILSAKEIETYNMRKNIYKLEDKIKYANDIGIEKELFIFLREKLINITIVIKNAVKGNIIGLSYHNNLRGWCYQSTETAILLLPNTKIIRGMITYEYPHSCLHSWLLIEFNDNLYVYDPSLCILIYKSIYDMLFETEEYAIIDGKEVQEYFIDRMINPNIYKDFENENENLKKYLLQLIKQRNRKETHIIGCDDINNPMFRNNTGYIAEYDSNNIKKVFAHFYK